MVGNYQYSAGDLIEDITSGAMKTTGGTVQIVGEATQAGKHATNLVRQTVQGAAETDAGKHVGKTVSNVTEVVSHSTGIAAAFAEVAENTTRAVLTPVNRLLGTFQKTVNRGFDAIDNLITPAAPSPV